ncbi:MAG: DUF5615 family PIN-like protein [Candidatus Eisenbacteria bacterium]
MNFLADVNVSRRVVEALRKRGLTIVRVPEVMDPRATDSEIISEARRRAAIVISFDQDFSAILAVTGVAHPSLLNLRVTDFNVDRLVATIAAAIQATESDLLAGAIVTIDDSSVRVHRLPLA